MAEPNDTDDARTRRRADTIRVTLDLARDERLLLDRARDRLGARSYAETIGRMLRDTAKRQGWLER